ncbi:MAG: CrcB family protein, partial [Dermatophilaceae bacterium]|nr:CrcB family protein [Dermatophilaceae bacterium]
GGVLGGFTTFRTAMVDTVRLMHQEAWGRAAANAAGMLVVGVLLALLGLTLGRGL